MVVKINKMVFSGFNKRKHSSIGGDFDGDGVKNRKDCRPLNYKKQHVPGSQNWIDAMDTFLEARSAEEENPDYEETREGTIKKKRHRFVTGF